jgi:hypothetical protein
VRQFSQNTDMAHDAQFSETPVARGWALSWYGFCSCTGLVVITVQLWKHGMTRPATFVVPIAVSGLSLVWLRSVLKAGPPSKAKFGIRSNIVLMLTGAESIISLFRL